MNVAAMLRREFATMPVSWVVFVVVIFLLWIVPSTDSIYHREGDGFVARSHDVRLGLLFHSRVLMVRGGLDQGWNWSSSVDGRAFLCSILLTLPAVWWGRAIWRRWHGAPPAS